MEEIYSILFDYSYMIRWGETFSGVYFVIYKDDAVSLTTDSNGPAEENFRKDIIHMMKAFDLSATININLMVINFLKVYLDLNKNIYKLYRKPYDSLNSIKVGNCQPVIVFKSLVKNISKWMFSLTSHLNMFNDVAPIYFKALKHSGFRDEITYTRVISPERKKMKI